MEKFRLEKKHIVEAVDYIPIMEKQKIADDIAAKCILELPIKANDKAMPAMYGEDSFKKNRFLLGILIKKYLGIDFDGAMGEKYFLSADEYDRFGSGHIMNQIERFKSDTEIRDKCFDILFDFKDFEKKLNGEIYMLLNAMNDPCTRILAMVESQSTPEAMKEAIEQMNEARKNLAEMTNLKKGDEK